VLPDLWLVFQVFLLEFRCFGWASFFPLNNKRTQVDTVVKTLDGIPDLHNPDRNEYSFIWHALEHIRTKPANPEGSLHDWHDTLDERVLNPSITACILDAF